MNRDSFREYKSKLQHLMEEDYESLVKAFISIERGIEDEDILDSIYEKYMDSDESSLLNKDI